MKNSLVELIDLFPKGGGRYHYAPHLSQWNHQEFEDHQDPELKNFDLYIHFPFCPNLCTFCGLNIRITKNLAEIEQYNQALLLEASLHAQSFTQHQLRHLFLGGGTPTYNQPAELDHLLKGLKAQFHFADDFKGHIESDPRELNDLPLFQEKLAVLKEHGIRSIRFGVQDFDTEILLNVNRIHSREHIVQALEYAQNFGMVERSIELIAGLPLQQDDTAQRWLKELDGLALTNLSIYPMAHVPWMQSSQDSFGSTQIPTAKQVLETQYQLFQELQERGWLALGLGHFARHDSQLAQSFREQTLSRSLMGHYPNRSPLLLGLGVSALSFLTHGHRQNIKVLDQYLQILETKKLAYGKTHLLRPLDQLKLKVFETLSCRHEITHSLWQELQDFPTVMPFLERPELKDLIEVDAQKFRLKPSGVFLMKDFLAFFDQAIQQQ